MNPKDTIFNTTGDITPFEFNETVASVFDDMISRSVPNYREVLTQQARLAEKFYQPGTTIYDLGCSNGNFALTLIQRMKQKPFTMTAVDNSAPMIDLFKKRISGFDSHSGITPVLSDIRGISMTGASVIVANLTLQFIPAADRDSLVKSIYNALLPGGIFLLTEKTVNIDADFSKLQQEFYYMFKEENGYSLLEINRKREALENVLVPETVEAHIKRLRAAGFSAIEIYHKWFHFTSFICRKD
ncbi:MAG TPA: carboxy-S-adenosyl-L-methionine synthase CmoA [Spirochaetota bacterium]|nr:carboxy-S-adenosyl-L-methionine synthase CmoA [Spirochaetota bacterium]HQO40446.1 carboxy-S-adenosyl-L-methionine synthase CmoA [Spirochaetota bacterium]